jgi:hypothetical protein
MSCTTEVLLKAQAAPDLSASRWSRSPSRNFTSGEFLLLGCSPVHSSHMMTHRANISVAGVQGQPGADPDHTKAMIIYRFCTGPKREFHNKEVSHIFAGNVLYMSSTLLFANKIVNCCCNASDNKPDVNKLSRLYSQGCPYCIAPWLNSQLWFDLL